MGFDTPLSAGPTRLRGSLADIMMKDNNKKTQKQPSRVGGGSVVSLVPIEWEGEQGFFISSGDALALRGLVGSLESSLSTFRAVLEPGSQVSVGAGGFTPNTLDSLSLADGGSSGDETEQQQEPAIAARPDVPGLATYKTANKHLVRLSVKARRAYGYALDSTSVAVVDRHTQRLRNMLEDARTCGSLGDREPNFNFVISQLGAYRDWLSRSK